MSGRVEDYTKDEAAKILRVTSRTVHNYIMRGQLRAYRLDGGIRIRPEDLDAFREERVITPKAAA